MYDGRVVRRVALALAALLLAVGLVWGGAQVAYLASSEVDRREVIDPAGAIADEPAASTAPLEWVRAPLHQGQQAIFEVCTDRGFQDAAWNELDFEVWHLGDGAVARAVPQSLWRPLASRGRCMVITRWETVLVPGEYALRSNALPPVPAQGRIAAWRRHDGAAAIGMSFAGALLLLLGLWMRPPQRAVTNHRSPTRAERFAKGWASRPAGLRVIGSIGALFAVMLALSVVGGVLVAYIRALALGAMEMAMAGFCVADVAGDRGSQSCAEEPSSRSARLGLSHPRPRWWVWPLMPLVGAALWLAGRFLASLIPSTRLSAVETFVSSPSGALALALIAVFVPVAEELYFRGFIYGTLERAHGAAVAFGASWSLFVLAHLPQQWGAWGPFAALALTGFVLTLVRAITRSTVASALAHLTHNAMIVAIAVG